MSMTADRWLISIAALALIALSYGAVNLVLGDGEPGHTSSLADLLITGLTVTFVTLIVVLYVGAAL